MINIDKYRVAANIAEYHVVSILRIIIKKIMMIRQLFHVKRYNNDQNEHV